MVKRSPVEPVLRLRGDALSNPNVQGVMRITSGRVASRQHATASYPYPLSLPADDEPFHFTYRLSLLCEDICKRMEEFSHIDMMRVLVTFIRCRNTRGSGLQAKLVPLRFQNGGNTQVRRGHIYQIQQYYVGEVELLYVLSFYLPRFLNQSFDEKLITVFHELYHICPRFSGDIRRFRGTTSVHNASQKRYDEEMAQFARKYLAMRPPRDRFDFLRLRFTDLERRYGEIVGVNVPAPKLYPTGPAPKK